MGRLRPSQATGLAGFLLCRAQSFGEPLFRLLGAPQDDKGHAVVDGGTAPDDWQLVIKGILGWLDRYLGPVN